MERRHVAIAGVALHSLWVVGLRAQTRAPIIGVLGPDASDGTGPAWDAFVDELARRGYVEGRNLQLVRRFGDNDRADLLDRYAAELVALPVDLIYAARGTAAAVAAKRATSSIPVVFYSAGDPVGAGLVATLAKPGGNVTGTSTQGADVTAKGLQYLAEAAGGLKRFVLFLPEGTRTHGWFAPMEASIADAGRRLGATASFVEIRDLDHLITWLRGPERRDVDAVLLFDFPVFRPHLATIASLFIQHRLPSYGFAAVGFLLNYDISRTQLARTAAAYVERILRGARPADLPVEQVREFELVVNLRTAQALGLSIPAGLLARADVLIR